MESPTLLDLIDLWQIFLDWLLKEFLYAVRNSLKKQINLAILVESK